MPPELDLTDRIVVIVTEAIVLLQPGGQLGHKVKLTK